jgi:SAM-dependent methyltransferase
MRFMRESDERFLAIARHSASLLAEYGLRPGDSILDVGSGYGRLAFGLLHDLEFKGRYEGFDLLPRHVAWCTQEITTRHPNFRFRQIDIANARYNPKGKIAAREVRFPFRARSFDYCALFSVFTHMYQPDIKHYMGEIRRTLKRSGTCLATFFLFNDARLPEVTSEKSPLPMTNTLDSVTRYFNESDPLHAISYDQHHVEALWGAEGFKVADVRWGSWTGQQGPSESPELYQDVLILRKVA